MPPTASSEDLVRALRQAPAGTADLDEVGHYVGLGLASIVNVVNPRMLIIGGLLGEVFRLTEATIRRTLDDAALIAPAEQAELAVPALRGDAVLIGASELAWSQLLTDPVGALRGGSGREVSADHGFSALEHRLHA
jgi:predicted NBD/HSP70 family sugar kinase